MMKWPDPRTSIPRALALALAVTLVASCSSDGGTGVDSTSTTAELQFLHPALDAPPLVGLQAQFYARKGADRELRLYHHARPGRTDSTEFLRFRVDAQSLSRRPDGSAITSGDSVLITVTIVDLANLVVDFQPAGLRFAADRPADLRLAFEEADDDLDDDGDVDGDDDGVEMLLAIWRRETIADPWVRQPSMVNTDGDEVETDVYSFTNYAIAYRKAR